MEYCTLKCQMLFLSSVLDGVFPLRMGLVPTLPSVLQDSYRHPQCSSELLGSLRPLCTTDWVLYHCVVSSDLGSLLALHSEVNLIQRFASSRYLLKMEMTRGPLLFLF